MSTPAHSKAWRERNPNAVREYSDAHYARNREAILAKKRSPEGRAKGAENMRRARASNPEHYRAKNREWWAAHPGLKAEKCRRAYEKGKANGKAAAHSRSQYARKKERGLYPLILERNKQSGYRQREQLTDCYVRCLLLRKNGDLTRADIPKTLVDLKREQVRLQRELQLPRTKPRKKKK